MAIENTIEDIVDMAGEVLDHSDMGTKIDKEYQDKLKVIHSLMKEVHEHCMGDDSDEGGDEGEENENMKESLASEAPPYNQVTQKDILVRRGVLKKKGNKHVLAKEQYNDALVNKTVAYVKKMKSVTEKKDDPCWNSHEMIGMKKGKGGKPVPNCVPKK